MISRVASFLRRQPEWLLVSAGLVWIGILALLDYLAPLDVSFLIFYVAPVLFLVWFVGLGAGLLGALASAAYWMWEDVFSPHAYPNATVADWNIGVRLVFLVAFAWVVAELKSALLRERQAAQERLERDLQIAEEVQTRLFPRKDPEIPGLDCHGRCLPARGVAGDYYDFLPLDSGHAGIAVGDVAGKGLSAALLMASLQGSLRSFASLHDDGPAHLATDLNAQLHDLTDSNRFATFFWAVFDETQHALTWVNAGHNAPMLLRASGALERLRAGGPPLGALPGARYRQESTTLARGDLLVIFTDGVTEAVDPGDEEYGEARLERLLREAAALPLSALSDRILESIRVFGAGAPQNDDITLVVARAT